MVGESGAAGAGVGPPGHRPRPVLGQGGVGHERAHRDGRLGETGTLGGPGQHGLAPVAERGDLVGDLDPEAGFGARGPQADGEGGTVAFTVGEPAEELPRLVRPAVDAALERSAPAHRLEDHPAGDGVGPRRRAGDAEVIALGQLDGHGCHRVVVGPTDADPVGGGVRGPHGPQVLAPAGADQRVHRGGVPPSPAGGRFPLVGRAGPQVGDDIDLVGRVGPAPVPAPPPTRVEVSADGEQRRDRGDEAGSRVDGHGEDPTDGHGRHEGQGAGWARRGLGGRRLRRCPGIRSGRCADPRSAVDGCGRPRGRSGRGWWDELEVHHPDPDDGPGGEHGGHPYGRPVHTGVGGRDERAEPRATVVGLDQGVGRRDRGVVEAEVTGRPAPDQHRALQARPGGSEWPGDHEQVGTSRRGCRPDGDGRAPVQAAVGQRRGGLDRDAVDHKAAPGRRTGPGVGQVPGGAAGVRPVADLDVGAAPGVRQPDGDGRTDRGGGVGSGALPPGRGRAGVGQGPSIRIRQPCR